MQHRRRDAAGENATQPAGAVAPHRDQGRAVVARGGQQTGHGIANQKVRLTVRASLARGLLQGSSGALLERHRHVGVGRGRRIRHRRQQQSSIRRAQADALPHRLAAGG